MTKLRKKLLLSVLTLALTFIALGSTTFAWFTLGNDATVNAFTGTVQGGKGIDIAFVKEGESITESNVKATFQQYAWAMSVDLSTEVAKHTKLKFKDLTSVEGRVITDIKGTSATANTDYLEIKLYVRSMGELSELNLTSLTDVLSTAFDWSPDASVLNDSPHDPVQDNDYIFKVGTSTKWNALNALRVSFTVGNTNTVTNVLEFQTNYDHGAANDTATGLAAKYAAEKNHIITQYIDTDNTKALPSTKVINTLTDEKTVSTNKFYTAKLDGQLNGNPAAINLLSGTATADAKYTYEDNGTNYYIYELVLRVWMEGWDGDCINAVLTKSVGFGFTLESKPKPASN